MMRCLTCGALPGYCNHQGGSYDDGVKPGPDGQLWLGVAAALVVMAFVIVVWRLAVVVV